MGTLLDQPTLIAYSPPADNAALAALTTGYLTPILSGVQDEIARWLKYDPTLTVHTNEEGVAILVIGGKYAGRYKLEMAHYPFIPGDAPTIFLSIALTYAAALVDPGQVPLTYAQVNHDDGEVYCLAPGVPEGLAGVSYGFGDTAPTVTAVGYIAAYVAGYATGIGDPVPSGGGTGFAATATVVGGALTAVTVSAAGAGFTSTPILTLTGGGGSGAACMAVLNSAGGIGSVVVTNAGAGYTSAPTIAVSSAPSFGALPLPESIRRAAVLLAREALAFDQPLAAMQANPIGGPIASRRTRSQATTYRAPAKDDCLGYGSPLAKRAERLLHSWRRRRYFTLLDG